MPRGPKGNERPADPFEAGIIVSRHAVVGTTEELREKDPHAVALGRLPRVRSILKILLVALGFLFIVGVSLANEGILISSTITYEDSSKILYRRTCTYLTLEGITRRVGPVQQSQYAHLYRCARSPY